MPKNIILCSDGTGNAGGKGNGTNVWRIFNAIHHQPRPDLQQVACYDDGVGSQDYQILRAIGGAFGWGISENLCQLYGFLMLHYRPGDRIYLFGFSRGAFTVRTLANLIRYAGVADCDGLSIQGIHDRAAEALELYRQRDAQHSAGHDADGSDALKKFKAEHGRLSDDAVPTKHIPIEFIGVWDTVEALGLPIDEMKHGLDRWFGLQFREGENDLHPRIKHACQALSIDEERLTFHPVLWDEDRKVEGQTVEQVWFPGVHANVGGGYPRDQMALVALVWMMVKANAHGLEFHETLWQEHRRDSDPNGQIYDSRAGLGMYYRYGPRDLRRIAEAANVKVIKIHAGALERIKQATDEYAPTGLPKDYTVEPPGAGPVESDREHRHEQLRIVRDISWWRLNLYYLMLIWTLGLAAFCVAMQTSDQTPDFGNWDVVPRTLYYVEGPLIDLAALIAPGWTAPGLNALRQYPYALAAFLPFFGFFFCTNWRLENKTRELAVHAWHMSLTLNQAKTPPVVTPRTWWIRIARWFRDNTTIQWLDDVRSKAFRWLAPKLTVTFAILGGLLLLSYAGWRVTIWSSLLMNPAQPETIELKPRVPVEFVFDTRNSLQATPVWLEKDTEYRVTATVLTDWYDNEHEAGPMGIPAEKESATMKWLGFTRRAPDEPWFKLMALIGADSETPIAIGKTNLLRPYHSGRLYLFVNDTFGCYRNNKGTATIRVVYLRNVN
jgi:uncharacterized protein (DUF2235 family)